MEAGKLDKRITIQSPVFTTDSRGQAVTSFVNLATVWANVEETGSSEAEQTNRMQGTRNYAITIRYMANLTAKNRIVYGTNNLEITSLTTKGRNQYIEIIAVSREK